MNSIKSKTINDINFYDAVFQTTKSLFSSQDFRDSLFEEGLEIDIDQDASVYFGSDQFWISRKSIDLYGKPRSGPGGSLKQFTFDEEFYIYLLDKIYSDFPFDEINASECDSLSKLLFDYVDCVRVHNIYGTNIFAKLMDLYKKDCMEVVMHLTTEQAEIFIREHLDGLTLTHL
jgi:hypothetical protein